MKNATAEIVTVIENSRLELNYSCKTDHVSFSIADFGGNVVKRGNCDCVINGLVDISDLAAGSYTMCIIDGDILTKVRFRKA